MIRVPKLGAIAKRFSVGMASLAWISLVPVAVLAQSTRSSPSVNQPVTNLGSSRQNVPLISQASGDQPVTNPGVSGQNAPASTIPSTGSSGDQPVTNPGVSGQNAPASTIPSTGSSGDAPVTNPGVSGPNAPASTIPSTGSPSAPTNTTSPSNTPSDAPSNVIERRIIQRNDVLTPSNQLPTRTRTNQTAPSQRPSRSVSPFPSATPPSQTLPQTTGFIRTAIASQLNNATPGLDAQLLQATCNQNWQGAIAIVDRALSAAPANQGLYRSQLRQYRGRLESLAAAGTTIPNWNQRCTGS